MRRFTGRNAMAFGGTTPSQVFVLSINQNLLPTSVTSKPMRTPTGRARVSRRSSNGNAPQWIVPSKAISSRANYFIRLLSSPLSQKIKSVKVALCTKCSATFGNGPAVRIRRIPVIGPSPARLVNTTASSCVTNMYCAAAPVRPRALTFAEPTVISSSRKNAGSSPESDSRAIRSDLLRATIERAVHRTTMTGDSLAAPQQMAATESLGFLGDTIAGLSSDPPTLPCKYFYDDRGAALFQKI